MAQEKFPSPSGSEREDRVINFRTPQEALKAWKEESETLNKLAFLVESGNLIFQKLIDGKSGKEIGHQIVDPRTGEILFYRSANTDDIMEKYEKRFWPQEH